MSVGPVSSPNQCVEPSIPDTSGPTTPEKSKLDELVENFFPDVVEAACGEIPFVPDTWCEAAGDAATWLQEESAKVPPELQWNLESS
jgi:hypothetical protein